MQYLILQINQHSKEHNVQAKFDEATSKGFEFIKELSFGFLLFGKAK